MSGKEQAQYILNLPLDEWEALKKVIRKIGSTNPKVLQTLIEAHKLHHSK